MKILASVAFGLVTFALPNHQPSREATYKKAEVFSADYSKVLYSDIIVTDQGFYFKRYQYSIAAGDGETEAKIDILGSMRKELESRIDLSFYSASPSLDRVILVSFSNYNNYLLSGQGLEKVIETPEGYRPNGSAWMPNGETFVLARSKEGDATVNFLDIFSKDGSKKNTIKLPTGNWLLKRVVGTEQFLLSKMEEKTFDLVSYDSKSERLTPVANGLPLAGAMCCVGQESMLCTETKLEGKTFVTTINELDYKTGAQKKLGSVESQDVLIDPVKKRLVGKKLREGVEGFVPEWFDGTTYLSNEVVARYLPGSSADMANGSQLGVKFSGTRGSEYGESASKTQGYTWSIYLENTTTKEIMVDYSLSKTKDDYWFHGPLTIPPGEKKEVVLNVPHEDSPDKVSDAIVLLRESAEYTGTWTLLGNNLEWTYWHDGRVIRFFIRNRGTTDAKAEIEFKFQSSKGSASSWKEVSGTMSGSALPDSVHRISRSIDVKGKPPITVGDFKISKVGAGGK